MASTTDATESTSPASEFKKVAPLNEDPQKEAVVAMLNATKEPLVLKNLVSDWPCAKWSLKDWASAVEGELDFRYGNFASEENHYEFEAERLKATLRDFSTAVEEGQFKDTSIDLSNNWVYSSYNWMNTMKITDPKCLNWSFSKAGDADCLSSTAWFGSKGAFTPLHRDTYGTNLVAQLVGRKEWILFAPEDGSNLYASRIPYEETSIFSQINLNESAIDLSQFPRFANARPYKVILEPGDVLYVPKHWWHFVKCLDTPAISVNRWMDSANNGDRNDRIQEAIAALIIPRLEDLLENRVILNGQTELEDDPEVLLAAMQQTLEIADSVVDSTASTNGHDEKVNGNDNQATTDDVLLKFPETAQKYSVAKVERTVVETVNNDEGEPAPSKRSRTELTLDDVAECIVHPDVIKLIAQKIIEKSRNQ